MPSRLPHLPRVSLSDEDLKALGLVVSYWSLAESELEQVLLILAASDPAQFKLFQTQRLVSFSKKTQAGKKLLRAVCVLYPQHLDVGLKLLSVGKALAGRRKITTHWTASRGHDGRSDTTIRFIDFGSILFGPAPPTDLTREQVLALAADIAEWWLDLARYRMALSADGPFASQTTWHGPKPASAPPASSDFPRSLRTPSMGSPKPRRVPRQR